jgi:hypothetical protein
MPVADIQDETLVTLAVFVIVVMQQARADAR